MKSALGFLAIAALCVGASCSAEGDYCGKAMECLGGNDADGEACVEELEAEQEIAAAYGCEEQWQKSFDCLAEKSTCVTNPAGIKSYTTIDTSTITDQCHDQEAALHTCIDAASAVDDN